MTLQEQLQYYQNEAIEVRKKFNTARKKYWLIILAVAIVFGSIALYGWFGKRKPLPPVVANTPQYIQSDSLANVYKDSIAYYQQRDESFILQIAALCRTQAYNELQTKQIEHDITDFLNSPDSVYNGTGKYWANYLHRRFGYRSGR